MYRMKLLFFCYKVQDVVTAANKWINWFFERLAHKVSTIFTAKKDKN